MAAILGRELRRDAAWADEQVKAFIEIASGYRYGG